ncbi:MAG: YjbQ family protein [Thermoplasmata archaeon]|nr:MAG: YjbQ family protein [Thermoplasmata archaeon]
MKIYTGSINIKTSGENDIVDITDETQRIIEESKVKDGLICLFIPGSTGSITTIEYEPGLKKDLPKALEKIAPRDIYYYHHETWHDDNGRSHVKASILGPSLTIPIRDSKLIHGTWQQIVFIEFDTKPRNRRIIAQIIGE